MFSALAFLVGACIGSFLNVLILRIPRGESIVRPGSHCECGAPIAWRDKIPLLSWLLLRGRARCCGRRISFRYFVVEALTGCLFLACWRLFPPLPAVCGWIFLSGLVAATFIDLDAMIIPDLFTVGLMVVGVVLAIAIPASHGQHSGYFALDAVRSGGAALIGAVAGSGLFLWVATLAELILNKEAMGFGDVKLAGAIGAFCGWRGAVFSLFGGAAVGTVAVLIMLVAGRRKAGGEAIGLGTRLPFGPMMATAAALYLLSLHGPVDRWFERVTGLF